jgi:hypothetical protein
MRAVTDDNAADSGVEGSGPDAALWFWISVLVVMFMGVVTVMALLTAAGT